MKFPKSIYLVASIFGSAFIAGCGGGSASTPLTSVKPAELSSVEYLSAEKVEDALTVATDDVDEKGIDKDVPCTLGGKRHLKGKRFFKTTKINANVVDISSGTEVEIIFNDCRLRTDVQIKSGSIQYAETGGGTVTKIDEEHRSFVGNTRDARHGKVEVEFTDDTGSKVTQTVEYRNASINLNIDVTVDKNGKDTKERTFSEYRNDLRNNSSEGSILLNGREIEYGSFYLGRKAYKTKK